MPVSDFQPSLEAEARLLLLIDEFSRGNKVLEGRTKLAKLDFLVRYPSYFARALQIRRPQFVGATEEPEPDLESRMVRYRYGPWDPAYYAVLGRLIGKGLVRPALFPRGIGYRATEEGRAIAVAMRDEVAWHDTAKRIKLLRQHFDLTGTNLKKFIYQHFPEVTRATWVSGTVDLAANSFLIMRRHNVTACFDRRMSQRTPPAVATKTARVEIAGRDETWRLPAAASPDGKTYINWLLEQLDLPRIAVPSAPTRPDSDPTPVSINDYLLYSYLAQDELGFSVFGHRDPFKNIKRKYVFDITYGFYDLKTAQIQERLRDIHGRLRQVRSRQALFDTFFDGTALENRVRIEHELRDVNDELEHVEGAALDVAEVPRETSDTTQLRREILEFEQRSAKLQAAIAAEEESIRNLRDLAKQLEAQSGKLTRSVVSHKHLTDLEFVVCPRCGTGLASTRRAADLCYLCLQEPSLEFSREILIEEQGAVEQQLTEAQDLLQERKTRTTELQGQLKDTRAELAKRSLELDFQTKSYVSEQAARIAETAARRARLSAKSEHLREYLTVLAKVDDAHQVEARLVAQRDSLEQDLAAETAESADSHRKVDHLKGRFNEILERLRPPRFGEKELSDINRKTYLPVYYGRPFAEVSSPGLATLINVSHALAHHLTAVELGLRLPQILIIDGLSEHLGQEGLDPQRLEAIYDLLIETSDINREIQVIVVDNEVPEKARPFVRLELSEEDRLIRNSQK